MRDIKIGCVADDFTGASDIASFFRQAGMETLLINELPTENTTISEEIQCVVIALKTRTIERDKAVGQSMDAFRWLDGIGSQKFYFKYCSTFDSTSEGNIGPVIDAVMDAFDIPYTLLCPSLPVNGRTVKRGQIYVGNVLLHESHMKDHPLTPMTKSSIPELMKEQGKYRCEVIDESMTESHALILKQLCQQNKNRFYLVPDYYQDEHGINIAKAFSECRFFTGGSGLGGALAQVMKQSGQDNNVQTHDMSTEGKGIVLAGSCSAVTLKQIADFKEKGYPSYRIEPQKLLTGEVTAETIWEWVEQQTTTPLIYSSASAIEIVENQTYGITKIASAIESLISSLAVTAAANGRSRIIVAGGETSGAVTKALGYQTFYILDSIAPGVPVMIPVEAPSVRLILKSGNFGQVDFFDRAVVMTEKE